MLDIDFINAPFVPTGAMVYQYQSGALRSRVCECLARHSALERFDEGNLTEIWFRSQLISTVRVVDLGTASKITYATLKSLLNETPAEPTIVMLRAQTRFGFSIDRSDVAILKEVLVTRQTIGKVLAMYAAQSDLGDLSSLLKQRTFNSGFRHWLDDHKNDIFALPKLRAEFDRHVLQHLYSRQEVLSSADTNHVRSARAAIVHCVCKYAAAPSDERRAALLRAFAIKLSQGFTSAELAADLVRATTIIVDQALRAQPPRQQSRIEMTTEALFLWCVLVMYWAARFSCESNDARQTNFLAKVDRLCRGFEHRAEAIYDEPLGGCWTGLRRCLKHLYVYSASSAAARSLTYGALNSRLVELATRLAVFERKDLSLAWIVRFRSILDESGANVVSMEDSVIRQLTPPRLAQFNVMLGHDRLRSELQLRLMTEAHDRPLLLIGPDGSGKRSIARVLAKALLCEDRSLGTMEPCCNCDECEGFDVGSTLGYCEIDLNHENAYEHVRHVIEKLRSGLIVRHRVILLTLSNSSSKAADALLSSFEFGADSTTFIGMASGEQGLRPAVLSRCSEFRLRRLSVLDSRKLAQFWLGETAVANDVLDILLTYAEGRPGALWDVVKKTSPLSSIKREDVRRCLGLDWSGSAISFLRQLINSGFNEQLCQLQGEISWTEAARRMRALICEIIGSDRGTEAAFVGEEDAMDALRDLFGNRTTALPTGSSNISSKLAAIWARDWIIDEESFIQACQKSSQLLGHA